ncbi:Alpha/Beta hydrolase protein [Cercophora newfieldiana]|uniref:Alpha/Beta hydrolase protein n=1 Tax=Cercophora newfieldiana TaxID=92897 RepID=A0AA39YAH0_9PEZI|nr:Alpha/Beta hydrolase protein [Cercophora newfieldiana]
MAGPHPAFAVGVIACVLLAIYVAFLVLGSTPFFQRHFLYAHKVNTLWWHKIDRPEYWGFAKNQVTPFSLKTCDGQTLYAWHIMPLPAYLKHERKLAAQSDGFCDDITITENLKVLREDPNSRLIVYFHGNAGHIAQAIRPASYHALTDTSQYHVLAIDYRGFGRSTGSPTEKGLIIDAVTAANWAVNTAGVPPNRIVLLGQSLGTAVATATAEYFAKEGTDFAGVVLVAGFSSLPTMLSHYAISGYVPILAPFRVSPWLLRQVLKVIVDKWESANRLREITQIVKARNGRLRLHLVHAKNDWDIPCHEDDKLFAGAVGGLGVGGGGEGMSDERLAAEKLGRTVNRGKDSFVTAWKDGDIVIRQELFPFGGHNDLMYYAPMLAAVMKSFDLVDDSEDTGT